MHACMVWLCDHSNIIKFWYWVVHYFVWTGSVTIILSRWTYLWLWFRQLHLCEPVCGLSVVFAFCCCLRCPLTVLLRNWISTGRIPWSLQVNNIPTCTHAIFTESGRKLLNSIAQGKSVIELYRASWYPMHNAWYWYGIGNWYCESAWECYLSLTVVPV